MKIALKPELEKLVRERVERGDYESADELVEIAVAQLIEDDDLEDASQIRLRIAAADGKIEAGQFVDYDAETIGDLARDVHARGLKLRRSG